MSVARVILVLACMALVTLPRNASGETDDAEFRRWLVQGAPDPAAISAHDHQANYVFATGKGIVILKSTGLQAWKRVGRVFTEDVPGWAKEAIPGSDSIWAPDIQLVNGKYYLYYSVSTMGSQRSVIGLAVNSTLDQGSPQYKWEDRGLVLESFPEQQDFNAIDPALFADDDGRAYLFWGSYWTGIKATEMDPATGKPRTNPPGVVAVASRADAAPTSIEGAYVIKRDGRYYLFVSWDFCCAREKSTYKIVVGRSDSPLGPYVDESGRRLNDGGGTLLLMGDSRWRGPGHNSVLRVQNQDWLAYHVVDAKTPEKGRGLQLRPISWKDGWPRVGRPVGVDRPTPSHRLVGRWHHRVNDRDDYDIFFESTGEITGTKGPAFWELSGRQLLMKWEDPQAPGGFWIDRVMLTPKGDSYSGRNQLGTTIVGHKRPR